uniref:Fibroblast growth factor 11a n=1 Tax=Hucho hucho TaxID=62062 RepID=A0A4W5PWM1_9TELE
MAALASSLIRQRREVKDPQANRQVANKRKPCPKANKSLCQKQILLLISKVRLCGNRGRKLEKKPGESIHTVPVKSLDTPTHSRVLYLYYFLHCRTIVKTSKL